MSRPTKSIKTKTAEWPEERRAGIQRIIARLLKQQEGRVIAHHLQTEVDWRTLGVWSNGWLSEREVLCTIRIMQERGYSTPDEFLSAHQECVEQRMAQIEQARSKATVLIPTNIARKSSSSCHPTFSLLGCRLRVCGSKTAERVLGKLTRQSIRQLSHQHANEPPPFWIIAETSASTDREAWSRVAFPFHVLLGIIELVDTPKNPWLTTQGRLLRHHGVRTPTYFLLSSENCGTSFRILDDACGDFAEYGLDGIQLRQISALCRRFAPNLKEESTLMLAAECLALYGRMMNQTMLHNVFLGLWQVLEAMARSEKCGGDTKTVCQRIAKIAESRSLDAPGLLDVLYVLGRTRNDIVHRGARFAASEEDIQILNHVCRAALRTLICLAAKLTTRSHIDEYFRLSSVNDGRLLVVDEVTRCLRRRRNIVRKKPKGD